MAPRIKTVDEIKAELEAVRARKAAREKPQQEPKRHDWYGLVYLGPAGNCSIDVMENGEPTTRWLGRSIEFIPFLRDEGIDGNSVAEVLGAFEKFRAGSPPGGTTKNELTGRNGERNGGGNTRRRVSTTPNNTQTCNRINNGRNPVKGHSEAKKQGVTNATRRTP